MNSREKGKRGERQWRDELRAQGYMAWRGQQYSGSSESPDVVCKELSFIHFEVKAVEKLNLYDAMEQAERDAGTKFPMVAHRRNFRSWMVTMSAETFFKILRRDFEEVDGRSLIVDGPDRRGDLPLQKGVEGGLLRVESMKTNSPIDKAPPSPGTFFKIVGRDFEEADGPSLMADGPDKTNSNHNFGTRMERVVTDSENKEQIEAKKDK